MYQLSAGDDAPIEGGWVQLPGELKERAITLQRKIRALNADIDRAVVAGRISADSGRYSAWKGYVNAFGRWLGAVGEGSAPDWVKWGWSDIGATLDEKARELRDWYAWFHRVAGPTSTTAPSPRGGPLAGGLPVPETPAWVYLLGAGAAAVGIGYLARSFRR